MFINIVIIINILTIREILSQQPPRPVTKINSNAGQNNGFGRNPPTISGQSQQQQQQQNSEQVISPLLYVCFSVLS